MLKSRVLALGAFFVLVLALAACGGGVPGNAVVTVGDETIKKSTFDHWMQVAAISTQGQQNPGAATKATVPDAPDFEQCVAEKKKTAAKPAKGQPEPTEAQYKQQCKQQYDGLRDQVLSFLIRSTWLDNEASKQKVTVTDQDAQKQIDKLKKQQFPKEADYQKFLVKSGLTNADIVFQQRITLLQDKLTKKVTKGKDKVTDAQAAAYYNKNKARFATPERRDVRIVFTKTEAKANEAKAALSSGQSWKSVAKKYSIDAQSKANGGALVGVTQGTQEKTLDTALFSATKGKLNGPLKTQFGFYVYEITKITPSKQQTLEESKAAIKQSQAQEGQQKALKAFTDDFRKRWKDVTDCRKGFIVEDCSNAPKKKATTSTAPPGAQTQTSTQP
jgi:parvulin-like peptidyl-prolyl isomerase